MIPIGNYLQLKRDTGWKPSGYIRLYDVHGKLMYQGQLDPDMRIAPAMGHYTISFMDDADHTAYVLLG